MIPDLFQLAPEWWRWSNPEFLINAVLSELCNLTNIVNECSSSITTVGFDSRAEYRRRLSGVKQRIFVKTFQQDPAVGHVMSTIADLANAWRSRNPDKGVRATEEYVMNARTQLLRLL